jgi:hypothetical protein
MLALIYLLLAWALGHVLVETVLSRSIGRALQFDLGGAPGRVATWAVKLPASFFIGTLVMSWATYLVGCAFSSEVQPLKAANAIVMTAVAALVGFALLRGVFRSSLRLPDFRRTIDAAPLLLGCLLLVGGGLLIWQSLHIAEARKLQIGVSVWSDFGPHLAVIRSFSHGQNFPTEYPHFANGHARYHFMFQFLCGNLEYLGLRIDWAFNLPSILALASCGLLLYSFGVLVTGSVGAGVLGIVFFFFRSSPAWIDFLGVTPLAQWASRIWNNEDFLGRTEHEDWGLWNQNVFLNQRHLAFGLCVLWLALLLVLPLFREVITRLRSRKDEVPEKGGWWAVFALSKGAWIPRGGWAVRDALAIGVLIGLTGFWNGAVVIAALLLLFGLAVVSRHRLEFLCLALVAVALAYAQNRMFLGPGSLAVKPELSFGFLARDRHSLFGTVHYYTELLGIMPLAVLFGLLCLRRLFSAGLGILALVFLLPLLLASTVQFTPDIAINHKYVLVTVALLNLVVAALVVAVWNRKRAWRAVAVALVFGMTAMGVIDLFAVMNRNRTDRAMVVDLNDPIIAWAEANTSPREVFLTDWWSLNPLFFSGRRVFYGWPYYAWGAGYDVHARGLITQQIYGGTDPVRVTELLKQNHLRFIVIDDGNRQQKEYVLQEELLRKLFPVVFTHRDVVVLRVD